MKKLFILFIVAIFLPTNAWCKDVYTNRIIYANSIEGIQITFKVLNEDEKTCQVENINLETQGTITIPKTVNDSLLSTKNDYTVVALGESAFLNCSKLTEINLPNTITIIRKKAFHNCHGLTEINLPNNITTIEEETFFGCI